MSLRHDFTFAEIASASRLVLSGLVLAVGDPVVPDRGRHAKQGAPV